jgi:hypothetical protein
MERHWQVAPTLTGDEVTSSGHQEQQAHHTIQLLVHCHQWARWCIVTIQSTNQGIIMPNQVTVQDLQVSIYNNAANGGLVTMNAKGKSGSFARAIAFASREARQNLSAGLMLSQLQNGQYRPLVSDILTCGLIPKANLDWVSASIPSTGPINKDMLIGLCKQVKGVYDNKRTKSGDPVVLKGEKAFVMGFIQAIVADVTETTIDA